MVNIEGLDKAKVLLELYNNSRQQGLGMMQPVKNLTIDDARDLLSQTTYFDYLYGKVMKVDLSSDKEFEERLYDRDNGEGKAQSVVDGIRTNEEKNSKSDELWDKVNGKEDIIVKRIVLLDYAKEYIEDPSDENFNKLKEELAKSSGLSKSYVIGYIARIKKNCEAVQELINATYNEKTENYVYNNELAEMIPENGESKKSKL